MDRLFLILTLIHRNSCSLCAKMRLVPSAVSATIGPTKRKPSHATSQNRCCFLEARKKNQLKRLSKKPAEHVVSASYQHDATRPLFLLRLITQCFLSETVSDSRLYPGSDLVDLVSITDAMLRRYRRFHHQEKRLNVSHFVDEPPADLLCR